MATLPHAPIPTWTVDVDGRTFLRNGRKTFLLADTLWAAFSRMTDKEWEEALRLRRRQGFNAVNVSMLPIPHDRSISGEVMQPFAVDGDGEWELTHLNDAYFERARRMVIHAQSQGVTPVVVVLWCNYAPGTWGAARTPETVMSQSATDDYVARAIDTLRGTGVIYAISGDDDLTSQEANARYVRAGRQVRASDPTALITMHTTPSAVMPAELAQDDTFDFYAYQAGHDIGWFDRSIEMAARYATLTPTRPVYSMEPAYEGHGWGAGAGRHDARSVRAASWAGLLGGATAGLGYAAHGSWSWHDPGSRFNGEAFSGTPLPAGRAMQLPGAWDVGMLRMIVERENLFDLRTANDLLVDDHAGAQFAINGDGTTAVAYLPHSFRLRVRHDLTDFDMQVWNLAERRPDFVEREVIDGVTTVAQPDIIGDLIYIFKK